MWKVLVLCLIVLIDTNVLAMVCPMGWHGFNENCYLFSQKKKTFYKAEAFCTVHGAHLASVHGQGEMGFITHNMKNPARYWIGLNDLKNESKWVWTDHSRVSYMIWGKGKPDNRNNTEHCVHTRKIGLTITWNDNECGRELPFICKKKGPYFDRVPLKLIGTLPNVPTTKIYSLSRIPNHASKLLFFVKSHSKFNPGLNREGMYEFYTKEGFYRYSAYMSLFFYRSLHTTSGSLDFWLPATTNKKLYVKYTGPRARGHLFGKAYLIGMMY